MLLGRDGQRIAGIGNDGQRAVDISGPINLDDLAGFLVSISRWLESVCPASDDRFDSA
jgi:hypothetical protein